MWLGLLGGPLAWALQHLTGFSLTVATCGSELRQRRDTHFDGWVIAVTATALVVGVLALLAAISAWAETRHVSDEPPISRIHFLAVVGMATAPLFLCMMLMSGLGSILLPLCHQG